MTRRERKRQADLKRFRIQQRICSIMQKTIEESKASNFQITFKEAIKKADKWCSIKMRECPQEAHMIKQAAQNVARDFKAIKETAREQYGRKTVI